MLSVTVRELENKHQSLTRKQRPCVPDDADVPSTLLSSPGIQISSLLACGAIRPPVREHALYNLSLARVASESIDTGLARQGWPGLIRFTTHCCSKHNMLICSSRLSDPSIQLVSADTAHRAKRSVGVSAVRLSVCLPRDISPSNATHKVQPSSIKRPPSAALLS
ncbi:hypothetical protein LY76DRAFT_267466 [Colletotrichum caudatum]|nr:hypothetical protein LY76DRAFT_267466 [Colletotrichum caudatum]